MSAGLWQPRGCTQGSHGCLESVLIGSNAAFRDHRDQAPVNHVDRLSSAYLPDTTHGMPANQSALTTHQSCLHLTGSRGEAGGVAGAGESNN